MYLKLDYCTSGLAFHVDSCCHVKNDEFDVIWRFELFFSQIYSTVVARFLRSNAR
jgi:hypothetical protein